uniref:Phospholipase B-like n=1 Tax=Panagrellus redivivus TaxID=6233 RepID=A0A7E4VT70_PANRE
MLLRLCTGFAFLGLVAGYGFADSDSSEELRFKRNHILGKRVNFANLQRRSLLPREGEEQFYKYLSACNQDGEIKLIPAFDCRNQVAVGRYRNAINSTGWSYLEIETRAEYDTDLQAYAAGVLEGALTKNVLSYHISNTVLDYCTGFKGYCKRLTKYLTEHLKYVKNKIDTAPRDDPYWQSIRRSYLQLSGVWKGYNGVQSFKGPEILYEVHPVYMINLNGEFIDLEKKFNKTKDPEMAMEGDKCSGLVKVTPGNADILISQVTMSGFQNLLRVLKLYKFGYDERLFPGHTTTFASYPGMLYSSDDFALLSSGLAAIETTINVFNTTLFESIQPKGQLHTWVRAIAANQLARTGREWCQIFRRHNSGTYNNQWIILDYKLFTPYKPLPQYGLLYVLEQLPGFTIYKDLTQYLAENTYYASYNIPFFLKTSSLSGFDKKAEELYWFSWSDAPRAKIFKRDHKKVTDLESLKTLMRYNDYTHEVFSKCNCTPPYTAEAAISARGDLNDINGTYPLPGMGHVNHGALDYKGTNYQLFKQLRFRAISSPAYDNVPAFQWSKAGDLETKVKHIGHPDLWNFESIQTAWETPDVQAEL